MSRVVLATAYGGPEVLTVLERDVPAPGPGQAVVAVRAAGVNPADLKSYNGGFGTDPTRLPLALGSEAAGVVTAVGPGVGDVAIGDEVIAYRVSGGYADEVVAPVEALTPKPASLGWQPAAGLLLAGATAEHTLVATGVAAGDTLLVHGGAGGVGQMAVQLARLRGARVVATAGAANQRLLAELGAEPVRYGPGLADRVHELLGGGRPDAAIDLVGTDEAIDVSLALVADRQRIATIAASLRGREAGIKVLGGGPGADPGTEVRDGARARLAQLAGSGRLLVRVERSYPLAEVVQAHELIAQGHASGKIILVP